MKSFASTAAPFLYLGTSVLAQVSIGPDGTNVGGRSCPGDISFNVCCIGQSGSGSGGFTISGADSGGSDDADLSDISIPSVSVDLGGLPTGIDDVVTFRRRAAYPPQITAAPARIQARATTVINGFTCYGVAVPISLAEDEYSSSVDAALSSSSADPAAFTGPMDGGVGFTSVSANDDGDGSGTTISADENGTTTITDGGDAEETGSDGAAAGAASSDTSDGAAPRMTQAAVLLGGAAGLAMFGAM